MFRTQQPSLGTTARPSSAPAPRARHRARHRATLLAASLVTAAALVAGGTVSAQATEANHHVAASPQHVVPAASRALDLPTGQTTADPAIDPLRTSAFKLGFNFKDLVYVILTHDEQEVILAAFATGAGEAICGRLRALCGKVSRFVFEQVISAVGTPCTGDWKYDLLTPTRSHCM
jgi:hypothetical protein